VTVFMLCCEGSKSDGDGTDACMMALRLMPSAGLLGSLICAWGSACMWDNLVEL
jgi:hypothetical protein